MGAEEIIYSCHLDHPRPGANDNASGCVAILEAARTLKTLVSQGLLPNPRRTLRFLWPPEIEGSLMYLTSLADTAHIKSNVHLDMVGGDSVTKSISRISAGPMSLPSFVADLGHEIGHFVNQQTERHASGLAVPYPLVSREGSWNAYMALMEGIDLGSDHEVFNNSSFSIPGINVHDWPDRYIHTNFDTAARIDPTKLKRAAFIGALQGWILANFDETNVEPALGLLRRNAFKRAGALDGKRDDFTAQQWAAVTDVHWQVERAKVRSIAQFAAVSDAQMGPHMAFIDELGNLIETTPSRDGGNEGPVYRRNRAIKGPMSVFDYDYMDAHLPSRQRVKLRLGYTESYEALNLVNGERTVSDIHHWLMAEFGPLAREDLADYLDALNHIDVILK